jgi:hypothetical protein
MEVKIVKSCGMWVGAVFFQSPDGDWYNWEDMVRRVLEETRKTCDKLELHPLNADETTNLEQAIVISTFRRPATLVPSTQELSRLEQLWQTAYKEVWHLMWDTYTDIFLFPSDSGGM